MRRFMTRDGPILLLFVLLMSIFSACATAPTPSPGDVAFQQTQQAFTLCATAVAMSMPDPCNPTLTPSPVPTARNTPSPTPMPFTGWKQFTEQGDWVRDMPPGFVPQCEGMVGCPGWMYIQYVNGEPVGDNPKGTPGYWPWVLVVIGVLAIFVPWMYFGAWQATAPARETARAMRLFTDQQLESKKQPKLPAPNNQLVPMAKVNTWLGEFLKSHPDEKLHGELVKVVGPYASQPTMPLAVLIGVFVRFDREHRTKYVSKFQKHLESRGKNSGD